MTGRACQISRSVSEGLAAAGSKVDDVIVVIPRPVGRDEVEDILRLGRVSGVMVLPGSAVGCCAHSRVGTLPHAGQWTLPSMPAQGLMILGAPRALALSWLRQAFFAGIRICLWMEPDGNWQFRSLSLEFFRQSSLRVIARGHRLLFGTSHGANPSTLDRLESRLAKLSSTLQSPMGEMGGNDPGLPRGILQVTATLGAGGAERQLVRLANSLAETGNSVDVLCQTLTTRDDAFFLADLSPEIRVFRLRLLPEIFAGLSPTEQAALRRQLAASGSVRLTRLLPAALADDVLCYLAEFLVIRPAVVHLWQDYTNIAAGLAAVFAGVPCVVLSQRNLAPFRFGYAQPYMRPIYRFLAHQPGIVMINNSHAGAADYARWLGLDSKRIGIIYNGVDEALERPPQEEVNAWRLRHGIPLGRPVVGGVFRLSPEKNPLLWIEAASMVAKQDPLALVLLVGKGPMRQEVVDHAKKLDISDRLYLVEPESDVCLPISSMDVFLLASNFEGTPNVLLEAQLLGCPVVTTAAGGCPETVKDGDTGWVISSPTADALAERILAVLKDAGWRRRAEAEGPRFVRERFGSSRLSAEVLNCYKSIPVSA